MKTIFLNIPDRNKKSVITNICQRLGIELKTVNAGDVDKTVLFIVSGKDVPANVKSDVKAPALYTLPELILFNEFDDESLEEFLNAYKTSGLERVKLKAVVTPFNITWTLYQLVEHLKEEAR